MKIDISTIRETIQEFPNASDQLLPLLHRIQSDFKHIPEGALALIASHLNLSRAEVHGVISFYHDFTETPVGKHHIQICCAEACQALGSRSLELYAQSSLGLDFGNTTVSGEISMSPVYCLGNCACGPSVRINDDVYGRVDLKRFDQLLEDIREAEV